MSAEVRAAIRRLRQANIAGVLKDSDHRDAGHCQAEWSKLAPHADEPRPATAAGADMRATERPPADEYRGWTGLVPALIVKAEHPQEAEANAAAFIEKLEALIAEDPYVELAGEPTATQLLIDQAAAKARLFGIALEVKT